MNKFFILILSMEFFIGCQKNNDSQIGELQKKKSDSESHVVQLQNQIIKLATDSSNEVKNINYISDCVLQLQNQVTKLAADSSNEIESINYIWKQSLISQTNFNKLQLEFYSGEYANNWVSVTPDSKGYGLLKTPFGNLVIATENVEPYLDGYKIYLKIGNPTTADFNGFSLIYSSFQTTNTFETYQAATNSFTDKLAAGYWTPFSFILAPANTDRLRNASVRVELNQINLYEKKTTPSP